MCAFPSSAPTHAAVVPSIWLLPTGMATAMLQLPELYHTMQLLYRVTMQPRTCSAALVMLSRTAPQHYTNSCCTVVACFCPHFHTLAPPRSEFALSTPTRRRPTELPYSRTTAPPRIAPQPHHVSTPPPYHATSPQLRRGVGLTLPQRFSAGIALFPTSPHCFASLPRCHCAALPQRHQTAIYHCLCVLCCRVGGSSVQQRVAAGPRRGMLRGLIQRPARCAQRGPARKLARRFRLARRAAVTLP